MKQFPFSLDSDEDLITIQAWIEGYEIRLALDTAATHTVIDSNVLLMLGHPLDQSTSVVPIETASGIMEAKQIELGH